MSVERRTINDEGLDDVGADQRICPIDLTGFDPQNYINYNNFCPKKSLKSPISLDKFLSKKSPEKHQFSDQRIF